MKAIEAASGSQSILLGKPNKEVFDMIRKDHNLEDEPAEKFIMFGDKLDTDIAFGYNCGIDTVLVYSGVTSKSKYEELQAKFPDYQPTFKFDSIKDLAPE